MNANQEANTKPNDEPRFFVRVALERGRTVETDPATRGKPRDGTDTNHETSQPNNRSCCLLLLLLFVPSMG